MSDVNFLGGGEMAALIRAKDWSQTPLGPIESWPQSLRTAVSLCVASNFPINLIWGPRHTQIYNDGYRFICGDAHPTALGQGYDVTWASAWPQIGTPFERARNGETSFIENQRMFLTRNAYLEETFFTFSLSPIRDERGEVGGVFHPVTETTRTMLSQRRLRALRGLGEAIADALDFDQLAKDAIDALIGFEFSVPFVLVYLLSSDERHYRLAAQCGIGADTPITPRELALDAAAPWPIAEAIAGSGLMECEGVRARLQGVRCGPYETAPDKAFVAPIRASPTGLPSAVAIFGVSAALPLDEEYRGFFDLLATSITSAFGVSKARNDERARTEALAALDSAKTAFFSNVSHEFRTPLTLLLGPLDQILSGPVALPPAQRQELEIVRRNANRLLKLVNNLLDFSRLEAGRVQASFEPTDLAGLTADLASNFRSICESAGLALEIDCPALSQPVYVDRDMWEKIVLNIVSNAFKFTLEGAIHVRLREHEGAVELSISDSGVGVGASELPRLFERFHRIEGQRGRTHEGTGIGLALVHELVGLHGGTVTAESVEGEGLTLRVTLPFGSAHLAAAQLREATPLSSTNARPRAYVEEALSWRSGAPDAEPAGAASEVSAPAHASRSRIVLADDNADMRNYIKRILQGGGYEVEACANGVAALAAARARRPDIVLTDVMMPELDGFGLLAALRAIPEFEGLPVILLSARAGEEARIEGLAAGADDYLVKPFSARELRARIDGAIGLARSRREAIAREIAINVQLEQRVRERTAELIAANQKLSDREAYFRALYLATPIMMHSADNQGRILEINDAWTRRTGYARSEVIGRTLNDFMIASQHRRREDEDRPRFLREGGCERLPYTLLTKSGEAFATEISAILHSNGPGDQAFVVVVDVSQREATEGRLRENALELQRANERLSRFSTIAAHDLQEPLRKLEYFSDSLLADLSPVVFGETAEYLKFMHDAARRMRSLINALLLFSRAENIGLKTTELDMNFLAKRAISDCALSIEEAKATVEVAPLPTVVGDEGLVHRLLLNLISNAVKYRMPATAARIFISASPAGEATIFKVADNGVGIAAEHCEIVFEPFTRLNPDEQVKGTGIGLAFCKTVCERHGWRLNVASEVGVGSTFSIVVPGPMENTRHV